MKRMCAARRWQNSIFQRINIIFSIISFLIPYFCIHAGEEETSESINKALQMGRTEEALKLINKGPSFSCTARHLPRWVRKQTCAQSNLDRPNSEGKNPLILAVE